MLPNLFITGRDGSSVFADDLTGGRFVLPNLFIKGLFFSVGESACGVARWVFSAEPLNSPNREWFAVVFTVCDRIGLTCLG